MYNLEARINSIKESSHEAGHLRRFEVWALNTLLSAHYKVHRHGLENISMLSRDANLITFNHLGIMDPFLILPEFVRDARYEVYPLAKTEAFAENGLLGPLFRLGLNLGNSIPIDRSNPRDTLRLLVELIGDNPVWISLAPEGTRSLSGALLPFETAGLRLYWQGADKIMPTHINYLLSRGHKQQVFINYGEPFTPEPYDPRNKNALASDLHMKTARLLTVTPEHVYSILAYHCRKLVDEELLVDHFEALRECGYTVFPQKYRSAGDYARAFERYSAATEKNVHISFAEYMLKEEFNRKGSFDVEDIGSKMPDDVKDAGRRYKRFNPVGYLRNQAGPEVENIILNV